MRLWKKTSALFLAFVMAFALAIPAGATGTEEDMAGHTVILHTNDVHGAIGSYAYVAALRADFEKAGAEVLLVDAGDFIQGDPAVSLSQGKTAVELMTMAGYDAAATGNHEFDYGYDNLKTLVSQANFPVLAANIVDKETGEPVLEENTIITKGDSKIGIFGLETPETATKAHPGKIQGLSFLAEDELFACAQKQVEELEAAGCDLIVCLGHLGIDAESTGNRSVDLLEKVTGIDIFIDGHSHSSLEDIETITNGTYMVGDTVLTSTGTKLENVGVVDIDPEGNVDIANVPMETLSGEEGLAPDKAVKARADAIQAEVDTNYGTVFAKSEVDLDGEKAHVRTQETNLGDLITDAMLWQANQLGETVDAAVTNGGGIRASIAAGDVTKKDINTVLPFGNTLYMVKVTGAELLEALEASTYCSPEAVGGFPQVAGITYTINTGAKYDAGDAYPGSTYQKPASINRVTIQTVGGQAFDKDETYTIVTNDFLGAGGDTYYAFKASPIGYDLGVPLDEVVMDYVTSELNGVISADRYGQSDGRIRTMSYDDVTAGDWFTPGVNYVTLTGIMNGTGTGFSPNTAMDRAMLVTTLYRMAGQPEITGECPFTDVAAGTWYTNAVTWANANDIAQGTAADKFSPTAKLSREQLATFLFRFAQYESMDPIQVTGDLSAYTDADTVSDYAKEALTWAVGEGIITGTSADTLSPQAQATRAQVATILMRYISD